MNHYKQSIHLYFTNFEEEAIRKTHFVNDGQLGSHLILFNNLFKMWIENQINQQRKVVDFHSINLLEINLKLMLN